MDALDQVLSGEAKEAITRKVWSLVNALPQRDLIELSDARQWIDTVVNLHGEQAVWHAIRLNGFGGSEIGVLVRNHHGVRADHMASAHDIVLGKLMCRAPVETNEHMQRGHENEPLHASKFYKKYGAHRDQDAFAKLSKAQGSLPWMRYSPDEVALLPSALLAATRHMAAERPMSRWLADYKAPSRVEDDAEIHFQYGCQLAQGAILCDEQGIELHGLMLSQYDWAGWRLKDDVIVVSDELKDLVRLAGSWGWNCVMTGEVPPYVRTPALADAEDFVLKHGDLAVRMANASALAKAADKRAQELRAELLLGLGARRLDGHQVVMPGAGKLTANFKFDMDKVQEVLTPEQMARVVKKDGYDAQAMSDHLKALNVDLKPFRANKLDVDKLAACAEEFGIDLEAYVTEQPVFRVDPTIKQEMDAFIDTHYPLYVAPVVQSERDPEYQADQELQEEETTAEAPRG